MTQEQLVLELENIDNTEHSRTLFVISELFELCDSLKLSIEQVISLWISRYGVNGKLIYRNLRKALSDKELVEFNRKYSVNYKRLNRQKALAIAITSLSFGAYATALEKFKGVARDVAKMEANGFANILGKKPSVDVDNILVSHWGADDGIYSNRLNENFSRFGFDINKMVSQFEFKDISTASLFREIGKRTETFKRSLNRLMLSEAVAFSSMSRKEIFNEFGIKYYIFYATEDERTCEECGALHGTKFPISAFEVGVTASPIHAHCRCYEVPVIAD